MLASLSKTYATKQIQSQLFWAKLFYYPMRDSIQSEFYCTWINPMTEEPVFDVWIIWVSGLDRRQTLFFMNKQLDQKKNKDLAHVLLYFWLCKGEKDK